ncbi:hypothetical protein BFL64_002607 [Escherichia coli]|nr:hypothetical protein [Escherichia coli]EFG8405839.1 hypothetical protein [Escherichia coli]EFG8594129.1 hypothetical protein [Escherichia coli]EFH1398853.1 hypothetical protein [Escherichia coli]EHD2021791.1 hypothetical protein [Escherichia coli]
MRKSHYCTVRDRMLFGTCSEKLRREVEQAEALLKQREQDRDRYSRVVR